ncbi:hypothetical protein RJ639_044597 [Escallonia herrerae]|uniref:Uncharacterized protein n=1 Tax=Escallonia herrerae TaxID=1293975 RepID=A0AA88WFF7_9ASTE|nr:hypothetical protein RJ639_044597 [Escallonia herrerae]
MLQQIGNAIIDDETTTMGKVDYYWSHALISDELYRGIISNCNYSSPSEICRAYFGQLRITLGNIYRYDIYAPLCSSSSASISVSTIS